MKNGTLRLATAIFLALAGTSRDQNPTICKRKTALSLRSLSYIRGQLCHTHGLLVCSELYSMHTRS